MTIINSIRRSYQPAAAYQKTDPFENPLVPRKESSTPPAVAVQGRQILVNGQPYQVKGVCYQPIPIGQGNPDGILFRKPNLTDAEMRTIDNDIRLMRVAGINTIRTFAPITNRKILDKFHQAGIRVINTVLSYHGQSDADVLASVEAVKNHPAILTWMLGNEWNYNFLYDPNGSHAACRERINRLAGEIKKRDPNHPVSTSYGMQPSKEDIDMMPNIDFWGCNIYNGLTFDGLFEDWKAKTGKPLILSEYGTDCWNTNSNQPDYGAQSTAVGTLSRLIINNSSKRNPEAVCAGGCVFEWSDEWWKSGSPSTHDTSGLTGGTKPHPDGVFNEEWWGLVDIDRNPRPAFWALQQAYAGV